MGLISHEFTASSLDEFYKVISHIGAEQGKPGIPLWFRGQDNASYSLLPSLLRKESLKENKHVNSAYSQLSLQEDYRYQNFRSRVNHLIHTNPEGRTEWEEIYQHHFGSTRMMDWSESARTALSFSLEAFLDPRDDEGLRHKRRHITPIVWILNPRLLNKHVFDFFTDEQNEAYAVRAFQNLKISVKDSRRITDVLRQHPDIFFSCWYGKAPEADFELDGLICLSAVENYLGENFSRLGELITRMEFNPFFYLLLRYYSDAIPTTICKKDQILPPLAILHPYHSERIRSQRGAFTVFPNYILDGALREMKDLGEDLRGLDKQSELKQSLYSIRIVNPGPIAAELLYSGERRTELYPEPQRYAEVSEASSFFT